MRAFPLIPLLAALAAGCAAYQTPPRETPEAPFFDDVGAAREGQAARASPDVARRLGGRLRAYGLQPLVREDRRHGIGADTIAAGWVAGKDPVRAGSLIVVAVSEGAGPVALGGFAELARVTARLARHHLFPEPTLLFATLPRGGEERVLAALAGAPTWLPDSIQAIVLIGGGARDSTFRVIPPGPTAGATARAGHARLLEIGYAHRSRRGSFENGYKSVN